MHYRRGGQEEARDEHPEREPRVRVVRGSRQSVYRET